MTILTAQRIGRLLGSARVKGAADGEALEAELDEAELARAEQLWGGPLAPELLAEVRAAYEAFIADAIASLAAHPVTDD